MEFVKGSRHEFDSFYRGAGGNQFSLPTQTAMVFFKATRNGAPPSLWTLVFSQSPPGYLPALMNAAILGYYYMAYWPRHITSVFSLANFIIDHPFRLNSHHQSFLRDHFGRLGSQYLQYRCCGAALSGFRQPAGYRVLFGAAGSNAYTFGVIAIAVLTLGYSMMGGLRASLRTDVFSNPGADRELLLLLLGQTLTGSGFSVSAVLGSSSDPSGPGWVLLAVALLQIWSLPDARSGDDGRGFWPTAPPPDAASCTPPGSRLSASSFSACWGARRPFQIEARPWLRH